MPTPAILNFLRAGGAAAVVGTLLAGCAPSHDWRETRSADGAVQALFPCRPQLHERRVVLAGGEVKLSLLACEAGGQTWALATADLTDPSRHAPALDELAAAAATNIGASPRAAPLQVPGAMAHAGSRRLQLEGRRPDGQPVQMQLAVFAHGTRIYQATALGERVPPALADHFIGSLRVAP